VRRLPSGSTLPAVRQSSSGVGRAVPSQVGSRQGTLAGCRAGGSISRASPAGRPCDLLFRQTPPRVLMQMGMCNCPGTGTKRSACSGSAPAGPRRFRPRITRAMLSQTSITDFRQVFRLGQHAPAPGGASCRRGGGRERPRRPAGGGFLQRRRRGRGRAVSRIQDGPPEPHPRPRAADDCGAAVH